MVDLVKKLSAIVDVENDHFENMFEITNVSQILNQHCSDQDSVDASIKHLFKLIPSKLQKVTK